MTDVPVLIVTSLDPVLRDSASSALLCDLPGAVVVRHDITPDGLLHRVVHDWSGVRERRSMLLDHGCLTCALRADLLPVLRGLAGARVPPESIIVALPVATEAITVVNAIRPWPGLGLVPGAVVAGVLATLTPAGLVHDLFGDDLLAERDLHLHASDRRSVGEVLAAQVEYADVVAAPESPGRLESVLLAHLGGPQLPIVGLGEVDAAELRQVRRGPDDPRGVALQVQSRGAADAEGVWTLDLRSSRPFHPDRLHQEIEALGSGQIRSRGVFWLPTRPGQVGLWDGAGGQLSIGTAGSWNDRPRFTRLVITGIGAGRAQRSATFARALLARAESSHGLEGWAGRADGFEDWLGGAGERGENFQPDRGPASYE
jgi:G3E family GTPase